ncbi:MAG TPA: hypothetical protein GX404_07695 [Syntrophomonadaceae bacterium]|nr:hypothetical protein [Syntrophomonadaceae bacterium]
MNNVRYVCPYPQYRSFQKQIQQSSCLYLLAEGQEAPELTRLEAVLDSTERYMTVLLLTQRFNADVLQGLSNNQNWDILIDPAVPEILMDLAREKSLSFRRLLIPLDVSTRALFNRYHRVENNQLWDCYWQSICEAVALFGPGKVYVHLFTGLGETEQQYVAACQRICDLGAEPTILSIAANNRWNRKAVSIGRYRRLQVARYLIVNEISQERFMQFNEFGSIYDYGLASSRLQQLLETGQPFYQVGTDPISGDLYAWPGHDNNIGSLRNHSPAMNPEEVSQAQQELSMIDWEEEWVTMSNMVKIQEVDFSDVEEDTDLSALIRSGNFSLLGISKDDLRYLKKSKMGRN